METQNQQEELHKINTPIQDMVRDSRKDKTVGPLIGSIIIILVILGGGLYFWGSLIANQKSAIKAQEDLDSTTQENQVEAMTSQSSSDETSSIESDIEATDVGSLDSDISEIDEEY